MKNMLKAVMIVCCATQLQLAAAQQAELQQLTLNIQKLAQLKQMLSNMKKGYDIIYNGYGNIKNLSKGNFDLHKKFLDELLAVNPQLSKYRRVADIIAYQKQILTEYRYAFNRFKEGGRFRPDEIEYLAKVYGNLFDRSIKNLDELAMILTAGKLRMSDEERLTAIDRIYLDMQEKLGFLRSFNKKAAALDRQRQSMQREEDVMKKLYGE